MGRSKKVENLEVIEMARPFRFGKKVASRSDKVSVARIFRKLNLEKTYDNYLKVMGTWLNRK